MAGVRKETIFTRGVKCEIRKMKEFGITEVWGKIWNIRGEQNMCRYVICRKMGI